MQLHRDIQHEGNLAPEDQIKMQFDPESVAHLMSILTDLYSDQELAVIREYSTNAWDSHQAAGIKTPIEVWLPNQLNPIFRVVDHGVGMSMDDLTNVFALYGASTKRDTDTQAGMLGLGCKSGLTYTSQFTVIAVKDEKKATVLVTRLEDGRGALQILGHEATDESDGVEIIVPVKNYTTFSQKAERFYRFWERGSVLVNGKVLEPYIEDPDAIMVEEDMIYILPNDQIDQDYIVMGNVPYPVESPASELVDSYSQHAIVIVPIGTVDFTPNREALQYKARTLELCAEARQYIRHNSWHLAQKEINAAPTYVAAYEAAAKWRSLQIRGISKQFTYRGYEIPTVFYVENHKHSLAWDSSWDQNPSYRWPKLTAEQVREGLHVIGFHSNGVPKTIKQKVLKWLEENPDQDPRKRPGAPVSRYRHLTVYFYPDHVAEPWVEYNWVDYDDIKAVDIEREQEKKPKYRVIDRYGHEAWTDTPGKTLLYVMAGDKFTWLWIGEYLATWHPGTSLALITKKQQNKFLRENPNAQELIGWLAVEALTVGRTYTPEVAFASRAFVYQDSGFQELSPYTNEILDPELANFIRRMSIFEFKKRHQSPAAITSGRVKRLEEICKEWEIPMFLPKIDTKQIDKEVEHFQRQYPLVRTNRSSSVTDALVEYVNNTFIVRSGLHLIPVL